MAATSPPKRTGQSPTLEPLHGRVKLPGKTALFAALKVDLWMKRADEKSRPMALALRGIR